MKILALTLMAMMAVGVIGCDDDVKERLSLRVAKLAAMEYGTRAQSWFKWGKQHETTYERIMTGDIDNALIEGVKEDIREYFENPVAAQGAVELIDEAGLQFDADGKLIDLGNSYSVRFLKAAAEGFRLGVTTFSEPEL
jgi:hypothetical protein